MSEFIMLRYGTLYGSGTCYSGKGKIANQLQNQELYATDGMTSFIHVKDADKAAVLALNWQSGTIMTNLQKALFGFLIMLKLWGLPSL